MVLLKKFSKIQIVRCHESKEQSEIKNSSTSLHTVCHNLAFPGQEAYDSLLLSAPSKDITSIRQNDKSAEKKITSSCKNIVEIAEKAVADFANLKQVIIMEHAPRFDNDRNNHLAQFANTTFHDLVAKSPACNKIFIGHHNLNSYGVGKTHNLRYLQSRTGKYDGLHFLGPAGPRDLSESMINIINASLRSENIEGTAHTSKQNSPVISTSNRFSILNQEN